MTERSVTHATFVVERSYDASPARVFAAWADPAAKARWWAGPEEWGPTTHELDFRVGGRELSRGGPRGGPVHTFDAIYQDIVPNERIIYTYDMRLDETRISVSLATVELKPHGRGTLLVFTEQGAFLDGHEIPSRRREGTGELLDALGAELRRQAGA
ncbi:MAG TPA: SRPBCC family protein [Chloroflexota bacterium]|jgi:uncharacterized protein YndB with AHSA1/START domain|nr:SRPBCC family protein [Chloroflexota bacterium]